MNLKLGDWAAWSVRPQTQDPAPVLISGSWDQQGGPLRISFPFPLPFPPLSCSLKHKHSLFLSLSKINKQILKNKIKEVKGGERLIIRKKPAWGFIKLGDTLSPLGQYSRWKCHVCCFPNLFVIKLFFVRRTCGNNFFLKNIFWGSLFYEKVCAQNWEVLRKRYLIYLCG